ncbi:MAG: hypothetical protein QOD41_4895 [Cryptosporangiaceae bacterium]|nr:hypothetical protein [Cryptosporangiaceae bacterium]
MSGLPGGAVTGFPGGVGVSRLRVYDWPAADGLCGGTPHLHTASAEAYVVIAGHGRVQTITAAGYGETPLDPGTVAWFTPGTVHRLVNDSGDLRILVIMQNSGLPEAGDAVLTFPADVLADPGTYAVAAAKPEDEIAARIRRDLAIDGFLALKAGGAPALAELHHAAASLVRDRTDAWRGIWRERALAQAELTGQHLDALAAGDPSHLAAAALTLADGGDAERFGMCGWLSRSVISSDRST